MSLQFILGSSGAGKSHCLYEEIINKSMENRDTNYIVIVPEQFTLQTQKDLVTMHPDHSIMNIDILSFMRLAYRVFEETNTRQKLVLEDTGKSMILRKVIAQKKEELTLFQNNVKRSGFVNELKSFLSELYQYSIGPDELRQMIERVENKPMLSGKLKDMLVIYEGFQDFLSDKYIAAEELLDLLCQVVEKSQIIADSVICFDGFTGFTPIQYKLLQKLMVLAKKVLVTVTIDDREKIEDLGEEFQLFHMSKKTIAKLTELAKEVQVKVEPHYYVNKGQVPYRFRKSKELAALEHNLFRYPYKAYEEDTKDIRLLAAADADGEVDFTVKEIMRLIQEEHYRYRDIAIVTGDLNLYGSKLLKEYEKVNIPCFLDLKKDVLANPLVKLVRSLLDISYTDYSYESVFGFLRNDLISIDKDEVDILENYVLAVGIRGKNGWQKEWKRKYRGKGEIDLNKLNTLRQQIVTMLSPLGTCMKEGKTTVEDMTRAVYGFLTENQVEQKILVYQQYFESNEEPLLAKEYKQIYGIIMELFDKLVELLGDEVVTCREYKDLLESGLIEAKVGLIPPGIDQVVIGDIERTRLKDIKALFLLGVNDGIIPKTSGQGGIITDMERNLLSEKDMELAPTRRQNSFTEQFYLYLNLTKPKEKLYIMYSKVGSSGTNNGKAIRQSYLISKVLKVFPKLKAEDISRCTYEDSIQSILGADRGLSYLIHGLREYKEDMPALWSELFSWYKRQKQYEELLTLLLEGACYEKQEVSLSKAVAKALYGDTLTNSITRLEKYAACAYAHFLKYGLDLRERVTYVIEMPDIGNLFHSSMELFAKKLHASKYSWKDVPVEIQERYSKEAVEEVTRDYNNQILYSSKRYEYLIKRVERITRRTVWALCEQVKSGDFIPQGFELRFSALDHLNSVSVPLQDGTVMSLRGQIDRLDVAEDEKQILLRIVDYKSGKTSLDFSKVYYGLQLQLVVYLKVAMELEEKNAPEKMIIPAGIFYYNIDDPFVEKKGSKEEVEAEVMNKLRLNGYVNDNPEVIRTMDHTFDHDEEPLKPGVSSAVIPVATKADGSLKKTSRTMSKRAITTMCQFAMDKITQFGNEMMEGRLDLSPYKMDQFTACDYCEYSSVCNFDAKLPGSSYRRLFTMDKEEVIRLFGQAMTGQQGITEDTAIEESKKGDQDNE